MGRHACDLPNGRRMEYELMASLDYDRNVATTFIISVSGTGGQHVNGFSRRLPHRSWVVAVPLRPQDAPLFFEGRGAIGDGLWHLKEFARHLLETYKVEFGRFVLIGVSNGGNAVLRFGLQYPELVRGIVVITAGIDGRGEDLRRLSGIPIDMYVGSSDECGFFEPMKRLEASLRAIGQTPPVCLTIFEGAGHICSPMVDHSLVTQKILLMCLRSHPPGKALRLRIPNPGTLTVEEIQERVRSFSQDINLEIECDEDGIMMAKVPDYRTPTSPKMGPNVFVVANKMISAKGPAPILPLQQRAWSGSGAPAFSPTSGSHSPHSPGYPPNMTSWIGSPITSPMQSPMNSPINSPVGSPTSKGNTRIRVTSNVSGCESPRLLSTSGYATENGAGGRARLVQHLQINVPPKNLTVGPDSPGFSPSFFSPKSNASGMEPVSPGHSPTTPYSPGTIRTQRVNVLGSAVAIPPERGLKAQSMHSFLETRVVVQEGVSKVTL